MRRAGRLVAWAAPALFAAGAAQAVTPECMGGLAHAMYNTATDRYPHGATGGRGPWTSLTVFYRLTLPCRAGASGETLVLPKDLVFEDAGHPRAVDLDGDGEPELLTVEAHRQKGARLAVYARRGMTTQRIAATPFIGTRFRWLAIVGAADLDGDGAVEIAYVDRPHLAKVLRIYRYRDGALEPVGDRTGLTNHRFGHGFIQGGIRRCGDTPEIITADADWTRIIATTLRDDRVDSRPVGAYSGPESIAAALRCG